MLVCAFLLTGCGASTLDLHKVHWSDVSVPGSICGASQSIQLHKNRALVDSPRWPSVPHVTVDAGWNPVVYGDLDGDGQDEAALVVDCNNGGGTADGVLAYAQVIFTAAAKSPRALGVVTPRQPRQRDGLPTLLTVKILGDKVIAREAWYGLNDGTCCPSGRTTTVWKYADGALRAGASTITKTPSR